MITFRLLEETDLIDRVSWINTPSVFNSMSFDQKVTIEGTKAWYERVKSTPFRYDFVLEEDGSLLAMGGVTSYISSSKTAETYTFTNPLLHSKGYGTLMLYLGCRFTLASPSFECLIAYIRPTNISSLKIHQRIGFTEVRESRHGSLSMAKEGHLCFELTSSSFNKELVSQSILDSINTSLIL